MAGSQFVIPLVPGEHTRTSSVNMCIDVLEHMNRAVDGVFSQISSRLNETTLKLRDLSDRAATAQRKVDRLKGKTSATLILCSSTFPGDTSYKEKESMFSLRETEEFKHTLVPTYSVTLYDEDVFKEKLEFFHVKDHEKKCSGLPSHGLKPLPTVSSVSSVLLYNTTHNPYNERVVLDPLRGCSLVSQRRDHTDAASRIDAIPEAPQSVKEQVWTVQEPQDDLQYLPDLSDFPDLELPTELPLLSGIANDLLYEEDLARCIAPSVGFPLKSEDSKAACAERDSKEVPPLTHQPVVRPTADMRTDREDGQSQAGVGGTQAPKPTSISSAPPRPPPDPFVPPPPPPPSTPLHILKNQSDPEGIPVAVLDDSRANLMKSIQEAGGAAKANLRKVSSQTPQKKHAQKATAKSGDLMADLAAKLSQRRKGISGSKESDEVVSSQKSVGHANRGKRELNGGSAMCKISALIPPPPPNDRKEQHVDTDEWDSA